MCDDPNCEACRNPKISAAMDLAKALIEVCNKFAKGHESPEIAEDGMVPTVGFCIALAKLISLAPEEEQANLLHFAEGQTRSVLDQLMEKKAETEKMAGIAPQSYSVH